MALDMRNMTADLAEHIGHDIAVVRYGQWHDGCVCIECETCCEVLINSEDFDGDNDYV